MAAIETLDSAQIKHHNPIQPQLTRPNWHEDHECWNRGPEISCQNLYLDLTRYRHNQSTANETNYYYLLLLKEVGIARLRESDIHPISQKTPAPQYQPVFPSDLCSTGMGEDREVLMLLKLRVLTGEHANYSQIITRRSSLFIQFMITLRYLQPSSYSLKALLCGYWRFCLVYIDTVSIKPITACYGGWLSE